MSDNDNASTILTAGTLNAGIAPRISWLEHPDDPEVSIPVALQTGAHGESTIGVIPGVLEALDKRAGGPQRRSGVVRLTDVASLIAFIARWGSDDTVVYADTSALAFCAVLNDHPKSEHVGDEGATIAIEDTGWRDHRAEYACPRSSEWIAWSALDGKALRQAEFADFVESRLEDMIARDGYPVPLEVLRMARDLQIRTKGTFQRTVDPTTGNSTLINKTETEQGSTVIPRAFVIAIPVFEGGARYEMEARVRFTLSDSGPAFAFVLYRRAEIERDAFNAVRSNLAAETGCLVLAGKP